MLKYNILSHITDSYFKLIHKMTNNDSLGGEHRQGEGVEDPAHRHRDCETTGALLEDKQECGALCMKWSRLRAYPGSF